MSRETIIIIFVGAVLVFGGFAIRSFLQVSNPVYVVPSVSMVPTLNVGDLIVIRNGQGFSFSDLKVGDIIVFHTNDGGGRTIVHRIVKIYSDPTTGERLVKTKGDNNPQSYPNFDYPIRQQDYYGKVIYIIPKVGLLLIPPYSYLSIIITIGIFGAILAASAMYLNNKKKNKKFRI